MANPVTKTLDVSDTSLAYAIFRLTFGVNICFRGIARIFVLGLDNFAAGMMKQFSATAFPAAFIDAFAHTLPLIETALGIMLILGLKTRLALIVGGLMMTCLTFGTMLLRTSTWRGCSSPTRSRSSCCWRRDPGTSSRSMRCSPDRTANEIPTQKQR